MDRNAVMRSLPGVDKALAALSDVGLPAPVLVRLVRGHLDALRQAAAGRSDAFDTGAVLADIRRQWGMTYPEEE